MKEDSMSKKLTPWFDGSVKPKRVGFYQRDDGFDDGHPCYWRWNGNFWELGGWFRIENCVEHDDRSPHQNLPWRGLAVKPKTGAA